MVQGNRCGCFSSLTLFLLCALSLLGLWPDGAHALESGNSYKTTLQAYVRLTRANQSDPVSMKNPSIKRDSTIKGAPMAEPAFKIISRGAAAGEYQAFSDACRLKNGEIMVVFYAGYGHVS